jgi:two-component system sensor histidine kinase KdpD
MSAERTTLPGDQPLSEASDAMQALQLVRAPAVARYLSAAALTAFATLVAVAFDSQVTIPNISLIFVLPVIVCAVIFGLGSSLCAAVLGALAYNFFLTEPRYSLMVDDPANVWAIALLFVVACIASAVASTARHRADDAALLGRQASVLQLYGKEVVEAGDVRLVLSVTAGALERLFHVPVVVMLMSDTTAEIIERRGGIEPLDAEMEAARSALTSGHTIPAGMYPFDTSRHDFWPVSTSTAGQQAVIGLAFEPDERPRDPGIPVEIVGSLLALALKRSSLR